MNRLAPGSEFAAESERTDRLIRDYPFVQSVRYAFPLAWTVNRRLCAMTGVTTLAAALLSPVMILVLAAAVNELQTVAATGSIESARLNLWLGLAGTMVFLIGVAGNVKRAAERQLADEISLRVNHEVLNHAASLSLESLEHPRTQDAVRRAGNGPGIVVLNVIMGVINSIASAIQTIGYVSVLVWIEPFWSGLLTLLCVPYLGAQWYLSRSGFKLNQLRTTALRWCEYYKSCLTNFVHIPAIRVMRLVPLLLERYDDTVNQTLKASRRLYRLQAVVRTIALLGTLGAIVGVLSIVGRGAVAGEVRLGEFVAFWTAAWRLQSSLTRLAESASSVFSAHFEMINLRDFLRLKSSPRQRRGIHVPVTGRLECRQLVYRYPEAMHNAVDGVTLAIEPGETVAFVGPNGAGKTTLARLISGLYEPAGGEVLIDGISTSDWDRESLYRGMALMPQELFRLETTAHENIAIGNAEQLLDDRERVCQVARRTGVDRFLRDLPRGYDTHLGRVFGECDLSGGQWRRISLARTLASDARIVIFDEPFAGLDPDAELRLNDVFKELVAERTAIVISHRFSFVHLADRIIVMEAGRIAEQGTHRELMQRGGLYASLYRASMEKFDLSAESPERRIA